MFNTHNADYNDRGTGAFVITGSNTLADLVATTAVGTVVASGTLAAANSATNPLVDQSVASTDIHDAFRYIRFDANSVAAAAPFGPNAVGLNEIRINAVPEPASFVLLGLGAIGLFVVARRRRKA